MPRSRNIKPGFFTNDELAEIDPLGRLLFVGLWTVADKSGRLRDRPRKIRAQVLPYDDADIDSLLNDLERAGFLYRYEVDGERYIEIANWSKHQNPHKNEAASDLPERPQAVESKGIEKSTEKIGTRTEKIGSTRADSLNLIPDSGSLIPDSSTARSAPFDFDELKAVYPKRAGDQGWPKALRACNARIREGEDWQDIVAGARRYAAYCDATNATGSEYVKQAATFCGPDKHYLERWDPPKNKGERIQDKNIDEAQAWLEASNGR